MDYAQAYRFILNICSCASRTYSRKFFDITEIATDKFVEVINSQLTEEEALQSVIVEDCLRKPRREARRRIDGENARDDIQLAVWMSSRNLSFSHEDDSNQDSENIESEVDNARKKLRLIGEPNDDNLAFGNKSTQPRSHESNTVTDDHEETEDDARDDGENQKLQVVVDLLGYVEDATTVARHVYACF
ncbi:Hypothetical predicted protein [Paramuricea clavata]|uniref:Uncharacterized protein n=1 Tax=Paramuricea clavata TaxID=317549 RepID=A0A7D9DCU4_PARCT|nr:Hypothetical predicted protein [Paramuricea clavata]